LTYNAADGEEPDNNGDDFAQLFGIFPLDTINGNPFKELETDVEIEYSRYADGTKEANENCLSLLFDLVDELAKMRSALRSRAQIGESVLLVCGSKDM
jgi:hypothetical protein